MARHQPGGARLDRASARSHPGPVPYTKLGARPAAPRPRGRGGTVDWPHDRGRAPGRLGAGGAPRRLSVHGRGTACSNGRSGAIDLSRASRADHLPAPDRLRQHGYRDRAAMAIVQAEEGGIGVIDRGFRTATSSAGTRVRRSSDAARHPSRSLRDRAGATVDEAAGRHASARRGTLVVVDDARRLVGCSPSAICASCREPAGRRPHDAARALPSTRGLIDIEDAERMMVSEIKKLPLVDRAGRLAGLITAGTSGPSARHALRDP